MYSASTNSQLTNSQLIKLTLAELPQFLEDVRIARRAYKQRQALAERVAQEQVPALA